MKFNYARRAAGAAAAALLAMSVTGCQLGAGDSSQPAGNDDRAAIRHADPGPESDSPQKTYNAKDKGSYAAVKDTDEDGEAAAIPNATTESSEGAAAVKPGKTTGPAADAAWNAEAPRLIGVALGEPKSEAGAKLGKPLDTYPLEDGTRKLSVDEYADYAVGYGSDKKVVFVEAFGKAAVTGLSGLRIGDSGNAAVKALGKPSTRTTSVIAYEAAGALLKLDLDPQNNRIVSIKLFSADRQPQG